MDKGKALRQDEALELVRKFKKVIAPRFDERTEVYMFGSYSKGYANPDSDIDVAVVVPKIEEGKWFEWAKSLWHDVPLLAYHHSGGSRLRLWLPIFLSQNRSGNRTRCLSI